jgi:MFS family permease
MQFDEASRQEWKKGWPTVLGVALGSGFGIPLFYYVFNLFITGMITEFNVTRGAMSNVQALVVAGALVAPVIGRVLDKRGFRIVFAVSALAIIANYAAMALWVSQLWHFAVCAFVFGLAGIGCGPVAYTRPINAWFSHSRGLALGMAAIFVTLSTLFVAPLLAALVAEHGWRSGNWALAAMFGLIGLPAALLLVRNEPAGGPVGPAVESTPKDGDRSYMRERDFILMALAMIFMAVPGAGLVSSNSLLVQDEGFSATAAAWGISAYAVGQLAGRIVAGWFLDRVDPRRVAFVFTFVPAVGLVLLAAFDLPYWLTIVAIALVGVQQGAEIDLFAFFVSRRFGLARYGTIYGWIIAAGWIGNAIGIVSFGQMFDATGSYALVEAIGAGLMVMGAVLIAMVRVNRNEETITAR